MISGEHDPTALEPARCLELLAPGGAGRIALTDRALPAIVPVSYRMEAGSIVCDAPGALVTNAARQQHVVCFQTDSGDPLADGGWSVSVVGRLEAIGAAGARDPVAAVHLPLTIVSGHAPARALRPAQI